MSVKKEASGRRSVEIRFEVPGTPEEVWQAIATGPGISSWLMPAEFEESHGKPVALKLSFGPGGEARSEVTAWDPPRMYAGQSEGLMPGSPPIAAEWHIEAQAGGTCVIRLVHSLFASTDDWDDQLGEIESGWSGFLRALQLYLQHFRGQSSTLTKWMLPVAGTEAEAWAALATALGLQRVKAGQRWTAPAGAPQLSGVVEYASEAPNDILVRVDQPGPAIAAFGSVDMGGPSMVGMNLYCYGEQGAALATRQAPLWQAWARQHLPILEEPSQGG
ncbi:SRPBCC family protein [Roseateles sp. NT4]|uniref:SRPBCC family protein n=1 Tax=Roseateles sp. NT4 TaxID=3453715 RepID=UPI003EE9F098